MFVAVGTCISCGIGAYPNWMFFCGFVGMFMFFCAHWQTYVSGTLRFGLWVHQFTAYSTEFIEPVCLCDFFSNCILSNGFCRVDVTEVQIAIVIMYIMTAFGGVSLWETRVRHSPSLTDFCITLSLWSFFLIMFINSLPNHLHWKSPDTQCLFLTCRVT